MSELREQIGREVGIAICEYTGIEYAEGQNEIPEALVAADRILALFGEPVAWDATWSHSTARDDRMPAPRGPWRTEGEADAFVDRFPRFEPAKRPLYAPTPARRDR